MLPTGSGAEAQIWRPDKVLAVGDVSYNAYIDELGADVTITDWDSLFVALKNVVLHDVGCRLSEMAEYIPPLWMTFDVISLIFARCCSYRR